MKDFINILLILILTGFAVGLTYVTYNYPHQNNGWGFLYIPLIILMIMLGIKLRDDY